MTVTKRIGIRHVVSTLGAMGALTVLLAGGVLADEGGRSCTRVDTLSKRLEFASLNHEAQLLGRADPWAQQLSDFDRGVRQRTTEPTSLSGFLDFTSSNALAWTAEERAAWQPLIDKLSRAMAGLNIDLPNISLVRTTGQEEFGTAYTRGRAIIMGPFQASLAIVAPDFGLALLAHELSHLLSQEDPSLREDMHALLGFIPFQGFSYPAEFESRRLSNPDAFDYGGALTVQTATGRAQVVPIIQMRVPLAEAIQLPEGPGFFAEVGIDLVAVDISTGDAIRDVNGDVVKYGFDNTNWVPLMSRNTDNIIQPEETIADNFSLLMMWRATGVLPAVTLNGFPVNDVNLLVSMEERLRGTCGRD